ncbi:hypothetical protein A0H81_03082 [Grifola frondosa]|uniref:Uncharacterized protein n=1 Tax=Grifola frondosa TaxID=5627 RepID=A0A1C7MGU7_GRIFR|nr:hypothetical protein A0H81_03082 [Grifola frondosa]
MSSSEFFSLSILQILSVLSFLTSILAVLRVGSGSLQSVNSGKHLWNWTGLPVSFSLGTLIGEEEQEEEKSTVGRYVGGSELVRMDWKVGRQRLVPTMHDSRLPLSMAKIIMSRHSQRRPMRLPRRMPGMPRPTPPSRLMESFV